MYRDKFNNAILYMQEAGILTKLSKDVSWDMQKTKNGRFRQASVGKVLKVPTAGEKGLTLGDTEGMFLLMGVGYLIGLAVLISEWVGGCTNKCREIIKARKDRFLSPGSTVPQSNISSANQNSPRKRRRPSGKEYSLLDTAESASTNPLTPREAEFGSIGSDGSDGGLHKRSLSESIHNVSPSTLKELYDGPNRRHSTIVYMDGKMMSEDEARIYAATNKNKQKHHSSLSSVVEHEVTRLFKYLDDHKTTQEDLRDQTEKRHHHHHHQHHRRQQSMKKSIEVEAEVNHPGLSELGSMPKPIRVPSLEAPFGEKLLH